MGFLASLFRAATPENPRFNLNSPEAWDMFLGGSVASSGIPINRDTALSLAPFWRAMNLISGDISQCPLLTLKRTIEEDDQEGKEKDRRHPAFYLLRWQPNEHQTAIVWLRQMVFHALCMGNGYSYIFRDGAGRPTEIYPLNPDCTGPVKKDGKLYYVTHVEGKEVWYDPADVLHFKGLSFDGMLGYSLINVARESLGLELGIHRYATLYFKNDAKPSVILKYPKALMDENAAKNLVRNWDAAHAGGNAHKTALLHSGTEAQILSFNPEDSQLLQSRKLTPREIANLTGIPPHKLGDESFKSFASVESEAQSYLDGLNPWMTTIEVECRAKLCSEQEKRDDTHVMEFERGAFLRADLAARGAYYAQATGGRPWMLPSEVRQRENLPVVPDDEFAAPANIVGKQPPEGDEPPKPLPEPEQDEAARQQRLIEAYLEGNPIVTKAVNDARALKQLASAAVVRLVRRLKPMAEKAAREPNFLGWVESGWQTHATIIHSELDVVGLGAWLVDGLTSRLLDAAGENTAKTLAAALGQRFEAWEKELAEEAMKRLEG